MFFPKTTSQDVRKSVLVVFITTASILIPSIFNLGGLFTQSSLGIITFVFFLLYALTIFARFPNKTKESIVEVISYPYKTLGVLILVIAVAWIGMRLFDFQTVAARIIIVIVSSILEFVFIYNSTLYLGILINFFFKSSKVQPST